MAHEWNLVEEGDHSNALSEGKPVREVEIALGSGANRVRAIAAWQDLTGSTEPDDLGRLVDAALDRFGRIELLVHLSRGHRRASH